MGEYFMICNLDKKELISPAGFGHGSKPGDFAYNAPRGVLTGLLELLLLGGSVRASAERIGHISGRWAGDLIAIIGDYFHQEVAGTSWSQDEWCAREAGHDGWVNITEHVVRAVRDRYLPGADVQQIHSETDPEHTGLSVLHADGTVVSTLLTLSRGTDHHL